MATRVARGVQLVAMFFVRAVGARRGVGRVAWAIVVAGLIGCRGNGGYTPPVEPMPPDTVLLSEMMQRLSAQPGFTDAVMAQMDKGGKNGAALMTPELLHRMRELILGKQWERLNRFPGWTMEAITPTVHVAGRLIGKNNKKEDAVVNSDTAPNLSRLPGASEVTEYLNVGDLTLDKAAQVDLETPSRLPGFPVAELVKPLGMGVVSGEGADPTLAREHAESARLAMLLNRLSVNNLNLDGPEGTRLVTAAVRGKVVQRPEDLMRALLESGHSVTVADARYFANFGHLHDNGKEVMMPFWVDTRIRVPGTRRPLLVPVSHAEYEWKVRGPKVNADVAFFYGIDGHAEFRTMDELNQRWVQGRQAHIYTGADALEVTRLTAAMVVAYVHQHVARPQLPFGGYYTLGVCQDVVSAIETKMTGRSTLFPNTADARLFDDPRDGEVNALMSAIPKDRDGGMPEPERVFGSLPTDDVRSITIPGLAEDLGKAEAAWHAGSLRRLRSPKHQAIVAALEIAGALCAATVVWWLMRRRSRG